MTDKQTLKGVIDRFEGDLAVIEIASETKPRNVSRKLLRGAKEDDYLRLEVKAGSIVQVQLQRNTVHNEKPDQLRCAK